MPMRRQEQPSTLGRDQEEEGDDDDDDDGEGDEEGIGSQKR